jgi:light-regulated signal transduction histidine kinase (bacteriophytochrome)
MRVEFPKVLRVLSHELRGPLGVMQGYVRLLKTKHADDAAETRMLTAILDATGRITAIARQASDLAMWQDGPAVDRDEETVSARHLVERAFADAAGRVAVDLGEETARFEIETPNAAALAAAIGSVVEAVQRDVPDTPFAVRVRTGPRADRLLLAAGAAPSVAALSEDWRERAVGDGGPELAFDRGGQGLALVLAGTVLEAHGAEVRSVAGSPGVMLLTLPKERGSR